jgi:hypothetical protein
MELVSIANSDDRDSCTREFKIALRRVQKHAKILSLCLRDQHHILKVHLVLFVLT